MEYDKKPNIIKYQGSKLQVMQQLTDQLAEKMGKSHLITWTTKNLEDNVSLAEVFNELTTNLDILGKDYVATGCEGVHCGSDNKSNTVVRTVSTCSTNDSSVCTKYCNGYTFSGSCDYISGPDCPSDACSKDAFPGQ